MKRLANTDKKQLSNREISFASCVGASLRAGRKIMRKKKIKQEETAEFKTVGTSTVGYWTQVSTILSAAGAGSCNHRSTGVGRYIWR